MFISKEKDKTKKPPLYTLKRHGLQKTNANNKARAVTSTLFHSWLLFPKQGWPLVGPLLVF